MYWPAKLKRALGVSAAPALPETFSGDGSDERILEVLEKNPAVLGDRALAERLMQAGKVVFFRRGEPLIQHGAPGDDVFFLLAGDVDIVFRSQLGSIRQSPNQVGEMAALEPGRPRSASVIARTDEVAALKVPGPAFHRIWSSSPLFQQRLQVEMAARHRERILAAQVARQNNSFLWFASSLGAGLVIALATWFGAAFFDWSAAGRGALAGGAGIVTFMVMLLHNPAFFWRRCFGLVLLAMIGTLALDHFVSIDANHGLGSLEVMVVSRDQAAGTEVGVAQTLAFFLALAICAVMDFVTSRK